MGEIVNVKPGYAKNFLIPKKKAIFFTPINKKIFEDKKKAYEIESSQKIDIANSLKEKINNQNIVIIEVASDDGRLYGSVNSSVIANKINSLFEGFSVPKSAVIISSPIKEIGVYSVTISLHAEFQFSVNVIVSRSESEVEQLIKLDKRTNKQ